MSFGALSEEAKIALARGAQLAGTGICSGEGGMLPEEQAENDRYFYELASGRFGWDLEKVKLCQAFHFKAGQGAKTGTGGHLPGHKVTERIARVRGIGVGEPAISPGRFPDLASPADFAEVAAQVREATGGIPVGFKMSAQHIEADLDFALEVGVDYVILDGRGGATGAAPDVFKRLRTESDFVKALALGADGVAVANSAIQAVGCLGMRACHTDNCPVGIATQRESLRARLVIEASARRLENFLRASTELMGVLARACGHDSLSGFEASDLTTWNRDIAALTGIRYAGVSSPTGERQ
jgi:glutamate synthase domain-containing protein 2